MKAKAIREQREAEEAKKRAATPSSLSSTTGVKRTYSSMTAETPATLRDASANRPLDAIKPARNFTKYVEYDFSKMTDTKGGFLTQEDDPYNTALNVRDGKEEQKPAHMTQKEWERQQLLNSLRRDRAGPFEPGLSVLEDKSKQKTCRECGSLEIDWKWEELLRCCVCHACKEKYPEKYSLLTKTEAKEDYLLTDRESMPEQVSIKDGSLTPRFSQPNSATKSFYRTWSDRTLISRLGIT
jgi:DNA-repair protein complementing XP-A cells